MAKGIYALVLSSPGQPVSPYEEPLEDPAEIATAIEELIVARLIVRVGHQAAG